MRIIFSRRAEKDFLKLNPLLRKRIGSKLQFYAHSPMPLEHAKPLINAAAGSYRYRIGDYRVVFDVYRDTIEVLHIEHRRAVYKQR